MEIAKLREEIHQQRNNKSIPERDVIKAELDMLKKSILVPPTILYTWYSITCIFFFVAIFPLWIPISLMLVDSSNLQILCEIKRAWYESRWTSLVELLIFVPASLGTKKVDISWLCSQ